MKPLISIWHPLTLLRGLVSRRLPVRRKLGTLNRRRESELSRKLWAGIVRGMR